jgi:hypothetical protein
MRTEVHTLLEIDTDLGRDVSFFSTTSSSSTSTCASATQQKDERDDGEYIKRFCISNTMTACGLHSLLKLMNIRLARESTSLLKICLEEYQWGQFYFRQQRTMRPSLFQRFIQQLAGSAEYVNWLERTLQTLLLQIMSFYSAYLNNQHWKRSKRGRITFDSMLLEFTKSGTYSTIWNHSVSVSKLIEYMLFMNLAQFFQTMLLECHKQYGNNDAVVHYHNVMVGKGIDTIILDGQRTVDSIVRSPVSTKKEQQGILTDVAKFLVWAIRSIKVALLQKLMKANASISESTKATYNEQLAFLEELIVNRKRNSTNSEGNEVLTYPHNRMNKLNDD